MKVRIKTYKELLQRHRLNYQGVLEVNGYIFPHCLEIALPNDRVIDVDVDDIGRYWFKEWGDPEDHWRYTDRETGKKYREWRISENIIAEWLDDEDQWRNEARTKRGY